MLALLFAGCFKVDADFNVIDFSEVDYENPMLENDSAVRMFDLDMLCPDGEPARLFAVYNRGQQDPGPVAVVLHSGPFDYVLDEVEEGDVLAGTHYHLRSRLHRSWGIDKVWETLGVHRLEIQPPEDNLGTLPGELANQGFVQLYPENCWGDMWHGEQGMQEGQPDFDGFNRNGRAMAWLTLRLLTEPNFGADAGFEVPVQWNNELYLIGLGDGGRGVAELLLREDMMPVDGILVDSSPDLLSYYVDNEISWQDEVAGLERIFGPENLDPTKPLVDDWSLVAASDLGLLPDRVGYLWSHLNPRVPDATAEPFAALHEDTEGFWIHNPAVQRHVFTNADPALAAAAVDYLLTGEGGFVDTTSSGTSGTTTGGTTTTTGGTTTGGTTTGGTTTGGTTTKGGTDTTTPTK